MIQKWRRKKKPHHLSRIRIRTRRYRFRIRSVKSVLCVILLRLTRCFEMTQETAPLQDLGYFKNTFGIFCVCAQCWFLCEKDKENKGFSECSSTELLFLKRFRVNVCVYNTSISYLSHLCYFKSNFCVMETCVTCCFFGIGQVSVRLERTFYFRCTSMYKLQRKKKKKIIIVKRSPY